MQEPQDNLEFKQMKQVQSASLNGALDDMIDQLYPPTPIISESDSNSFVNDEGITIDGKFYSNADFDALLERMTLAPNVPDFTVDINGQIQFDYDLRILPLAAPVFVALLPVIGKVFVTGTLIVVAGLTIHDTDRQYNKIISRLNAAQRAKVEAEKAKAKAKSSAKAKATAKPKTPAKSQPQYKEKVKVKGKQKDDIPERFRDEKPLKGESGKDAAERVLKKFKEWNPKDTKGQSLFSKLKKYFDTHFK